MSVHTNIYKKDVRMAIVILIENPGLFGPSLTEMFVSHFEQLLKHNNDAEKDWIDISDFNMAVWHEMTDTAPYKLYRNLAVLQEKAKQGFFNA